MTAQLAPAPVFRSWDNLGLPLVGGKLFTYAAGTTTPQATYIDSTQTTPNTNPVILNFRGEAFVWLDPTLTYKFVLQDFLGNLIWTEDNIAGSPFASGGNLVPTVTNTFTLGTPSFTWANAYFGPNAAPILDSVTGNLGYYARNAAEIALGVFPVSYAYPWLTVDRYGTNTTPGTTDMRPPIKIAWNVAKQQGFGTITFLAGAIYALTTTDPVGTINLPAVASNSGNEGTQAFLAQVYCLGGSNIDFNFNGAVLKSTVTGLSVGSSVGILFDNCKNIRLIKPNMTGTQVQGGGVVSLGTITPGSGYANGTYTNVLMTGGTGQGCCCQIIVAGGAVTSVIVTYAGGSTTASLAQGFQIGDSLSTSNTNLGGSGAGFAVVVTGVLGAGNVVSTAACLAFAVTSLSGPSSNITTYDLTATNCFAGFWCIDNGVNVTAGISLLGHTSVINGEYGIPLHNGGDDTFIENLITFNVNRPIFFYGCQNIVVANLVAEQTNYGFGSIIKAYNRSTRNITINACYRNSPGNAVSRLSIQVQCDPALFPVAPTVKQIYITHDEQNVPVGSSSIEFDSFYSTGGAQASTCNQQLFDQIAIRGFSLGYLFSTVKFTTAAAQCQINYDNLEAAWSSIIGGGQDIRTGLGFISSREFFCNQQLQFGGTVVTGTGGTVQCYIADGLCKIQGTITLSAKNGSGQATIALPFASRLDASGKFLCVVAGISGMTGLLAGGAMFGMLPGNSNLMDLFYQQATGLQSVTDANFTTAAQIAYDITYPI